MGFRVVLVKNEVSIQIKLNNLIIRKEEKDIWIPVDDITLLVIDNMKITVTTRMLSFLAEHNVAVVFCNHSLIPGKAMCWIWFKYAIRDSSSK